MTDELREILTVLLGNVITGAGSLLLASRVKPTGFKKFPGIRNLLWSFSLISVPFYILLLFSGKLWFSALLFLAVMLTLVLISNSKYKSLREPLLFSDYDYFTDAFRFPRLYFPFLGISGFTGILLGIFGVLWGYGADDFYPGAYAWSIQVKFICLMIMVYSLVAFYCGKTRKKLSFQPEKDLAHLGFVLFLWCYFLEYLQKPQVVSPFATLTEKSAESISEYKVCDNTGDNNIDAPALYREADNHPRDHKKSPESLPDLIAVQSESFFDPREYLNQSFILSHQTDADISEIVKAKENPVNYNNPLKYFDRITRKSRYRGEVKVPAFGANTIRTEFSVLTGIAPEQMAGHQFSPYQIMSGKDFHLPSVVNYLKSLGYYTVAFHPFHKGFYHRDIIFRKWGFDEFRGMESFNQNDYSGAYVGDIPLAQQVISFVKSYDNNKDPGGITGTCPWPNFGKSTDPAHHLSLQLEGKATIARKPLFVFVITMENHGPLHLEKVEEKDYLTFMGKEGKLRDHDLTAYLRHLVHADGMIRDMVTCLEERDRPSSLLFYGDHVPILPDLYARAGFPEGKVPYFIWDNPAFVQIRESREYEGIIRSDERKTSDLNKVNVPDHKTSCNDLSSVTSDSSGDDMSGNNNNREYSINGKNRLDLPAGDLVKLWLNIP